ncbi:flagellin lysine-N-methylase [Lysinibacillus sp. OL1_EC]|uniref:flagellin lysine-N-methylase n=1 Tax=unclassified Lysinibacillus TaxID=2636778 RepID=UPI00103AD7FF|nr:MULTISPECIES: flagellin lysine-N-methylase [unclassified Lysinibacillus]MCM0626377.1 flagellin lysine-N-methylase [Lysinibacillus sp. OL1_EC]TBV85756.1 hypothetical protein EW028_20245 [Lysinibacillus sp. OL1]
MKREVLLPTYFEKFSCVGAACEDTCCAGWKVQVDKKSFQKYRKVTSGSIANDLRMNITRERTDPSDNNYAKIKMDEDMNCAFLNEDKLCNIYIELGESYLCNTCTFYPRQMTEVENRVEKDLSVSCPEAARLILLNPEGIDFIFHEEQFDKKMPFTHVTVPNHFWDIRMFAIQILQSHYAPIESRLLVLGMFMEKMQATPQIEWAQKLPVYINEYEGILYRSEQLNLHTNLPSNLEMVNMTYILVQFQKDYELYNPRFGECITELKEGLQLLGDDTLQLSVALYNKYEQEYYKPFFEKNSHILENYLVNYLFKNTLPQNPSRFAKEYAQVLMCFLFLKATLIGMAGYHQTLSEEMVIKLIQSFTKTLENNAVFRDFMNKVLGD